MKRLQEKMLILLIDEKTRILCKDCKKKSAKIIKKSQKNVNFIKKLQKSVNFVKKSTILSKYIIFIFMEACNIS